MRQNQQCFRCKSCSYQWTGDVEMLALEKRAAITLCCFGLSSRKIGFLLGYSHVTILNWVREFENTRTTPNEDYFLELDTLSDFLIKRTQNPRMGKRFTSMQHALTWTVENEMQKIMERVLGSLTG